MSSCTTSDHAQSSSLRNLALRRAAWHFSAANYDNTAHLVTDGIIHSTFDSSWRSGGNGREWVYIDLGADSELSSVKVYWGENFAVCYSIETSSDGKNWSAAATVAGYANSAVTSRIARKSVRYVRILCHFSSGENYIIREVEIYGTNDVGYGLDALPSPGHDGSRKLAGPNWKVQRASEVAAGGAVLSKAGYNDDGWLPASVPDTILVSYLKAGAIPDPRYDNWQFQVSDSFFTADFWYRNSFSVPSEKKGKEVFLNFDAINWKADIYFNGHYLPNACHSRQKSIEGAFIRGKFNITQYVNYGEENYLAVYIYKNDNPEFGYLIDGLDGLEFSNISDEGKKIMVSSQGLAEGPWNNGGRLGLDNPTFHSSNGWDWIPTIRGRDIGIYNDVYLSYSGGVELEDPWMETHLSITETTDTAKPDTVRTYDLDASRAQLIFRTEVHNSRNSSVTAVVTGVISPCGTVFSKTVALGAGERQYIEITGICLDNPQLWWPNTYGDQFLYTVKAQVTVNDIVMDTREFQFGVREFSYPIDDNCLALYCNGTRIVAKGGNWGIDDALKLDRAEDYDNKARLTAEENLVMIRNWIGQTNHKDFYAACDKYGLIVWDDFWLANPADGPNPKDEEMFVENAVDKVKHNRYHASLAIYCGRNESNPPESLNMKLQELIQKYDGTRMYIPHSASAPVGSGGGYTLGDPKKYFNDVPNTTLRSEMGIPNVPDSHSISKFIAEENLWPISESWALHDFTFYMNGPANAYIKALKSYRILNFETISDPGQIWGQSPALTAIDNPDFQAYKNSISKMVNDLGKELTFKEFSRIAQMLNYEHHKAIFEGITVKRSNGALLWMSQSSHPSFMWQTYDYFLATNGGYFGVKTANQPSHAILDLRTDQIILSNTSRKEYSNVSTVFQLYDLNGDLVLTRKYTTDILEADAYGLVLGKVDFTISPTDIVFIKLTVFDAEVGVLGNNFYWHNWKEYQNYRLLDTLPYVVLTATVSERATLANGNYQHIITLANHSPVPALQARIRTVSSKTGEDVLPAFYADNYVSLMPGDSRTITVEFNRKYLKEGIPVFYLDGWNVEEKTIFGDII